jgi:aminoglycoside phosphotransferase (APT) family kinase protein
MTLPTELASLIAEHGRTIADVQLLSRQAVKSAYKVTFTDGSCVKARLQSSDLWADQVERVQQLVGPHPGFSETLMRRGRAVLEEWVPGTSLHASPPPPAMLRHCGALLASLHRVAVTEDIAAESSVERHMQRMTAQLEALKASGGLGQEEVKSLNAILSHAAPQRADVGIIHFDFCLSNLVLHPERGPVCVDNETMRTVTFDLDLARTFYRSSLSNDEQAAFLAGYVAADGPGGVEYLEFWTLASELVSAFVRRRDGCHDADAPLEALRSRARRNRSGRQRM